MIEEIDKKYKILLDGFVEQDRPYQCPECNQEMEAKHIIGFGSYPKGGFRDTMKPNAELGVGFECPECFCKSCFHSDKYVYQLFLDSKRFEK